MIFSVVSVITSVDGVGVLCNELAGVAVQPAHFFLTDCDMSHCLYMLVVLPWLLKLTYHRCCSVLMETSLDVSGL